MCRAHLLLTATTLAILSRRLASIQHSRLVLRKRGLGLTGLRRPLACGPRLQLRGGPWALPPRAALALRGFFPGVGRRSSLDHVEGVHDPPALGRASCYPPRRGGHPSSAPARVLVEAVSPSGPSCASEAGVVDARVGLRRLPALRRGVRGPARRARGCPVGPPPHLPAVAMCEVAALPHTGRGAAPCRAGRSRRALGLDARAGHVRADRGREVVDSSCVTPLRLSEFGLAIIGG